MKPMPPKVKKWIEALRSGKYQQVTGRLKRDGGFSCLGVLCEISQLGKWRFDNVTGDFSYCAGDSRSSGQLPEAVAKWAKLNSYRGTFPAGHRVVSLASLNDHGESFAEIADIIEDQWEVLIDDSQ